MSGFAPARSGLCFTGRTLDEMRINLRDALEFHLEGLALCGEPIPNATTHAAEIPENGLAEWLTVTLPVPEAVSA